MPDGMYKLMMRANVRSEGENFSGFSVRLLSLTLNYQKTLTVNQIGNEPQ